MCTVCIIYEKEARDTVVVFVGCSGGRDGVGNCLPNSHALKFSLGGGLHQRIRLWGVYLSEDRLQ